MTAIRAAAAGDSPPGLFHTRYRALASNTIDYWMLPDAPRMTASRIADAIGDAPVSATRSTLQLYVHVPFCAQRCRFCAFSGGNSIRFEAAQRYSRLLAEQLDASLAALPERARRLPIQSVHIGGGSPDLLGPHLATLLRAVRDLPGVDDRTELAVECTATTTDPATLDVMVDHAVTKLSFGIQSLEPAVRRAMRQPVTLEHVERLLRNVAGRIPIVNADLITGLPGQTLTHVNRDLRTLLEEGRLQAISSYLLTPSAAPSLVAGVRSGTLPAPAAPAEQAAMRLHTYTTFQRRGWLRRGTNTYVNPDAVSDELLNRIRGNECIGTVDYDAYLVGVGAQAVSSIPGARIENLVDIEAWSDAVERGDAPWHLPKCSTEHQRDTALWVMPLRWEGLPRSSYEHMLSTGALSPSQLRTFAELQREGLIVETERGFELSILGEVFMGQLVRDLKSRRGRAAVDAYATEGQELGAAIASGELPDRNATNDRQRRSDSAER